VRKGLIVVKACKGTQQDVGSIPTASTNQTDRNTMVELCEFAAVKTENAVVYHASNLDVLPLMADNSVDAIVTDPPYELGFMGKSWDSTGIAYSVELWRECLRVLKPGGHLLAFSGSRTYHRQVVAIEDAGFEIRDMVSWISNKTFPKSLDIAKAIDKNDANDLRIKRNLIFTNWMRETDLTAQKATKILIEKQLIGKNGTSANHYFAESASGQPRIATKELFDALRPYLPTVPNYIEQMVAERSIESENFKNREVISQRDVPVGHAFAGEIYGGDSSNKTINETAPATDEAKQWQGWGTALKPTVEPIVLARKPVVGSVADNVLRWGVGGLNIDASRIGTEERINQPAGNKVQDVGVYKFSVSESDAFNGAEASSVQGRWPANVVFDEACAELLDGQEEDSSRFFYVARASKADRNEGLEQLPATKVGSFNGNAIQPDGNKIGANPDQPNQPAQNFHPTVKPTDLMRYLIKLVTPAGGVVLDPFTGSGSTGKAALLDGYRFIGIEMTADYLPIIEGRLLWAEAEAQRVAQAAAEEESIRLF